MEWLCDCHSEDCFLEIKLTADEEVEISKNNYMVVSSKCKRVVPESYILVEKRKKYSLYKIDEKEIGKTRFVGPD